MESKTIRTQFKSYYKQNTETLNKSQFSNSWNFSHNELVGKKGKNIFNLIHNLKRNEKEHIYASYFKLTEKYCWS